MTTASRFTFKVFFLAALWLYCPGAASPCFCQTDTSRDALSSNILLADLSGVSEKASDWAENTAEKAGDLASGASESVKDWAGEASDKTRKAARNAAEDAKDLAGEGARKAKDLASDSADAARDAASKGAKKAKGLLGRGWDKVSDMGRSAYDTVRGWFD